MRQSSNPSISNPVGNPMHIIQSVTNQGILPSLLLSSN
jgi:hypothetical protein